PVFDKFGAIFGNVFYNKPVTKSNLAGGGKWSDFYQCGQNWAKKIAQALGLSKK
ncbi:MAG: hypothetical protein RJA45_590, partial [Actinomycetota bacterium]